MYYTLHSYDPELNSYNIQSKKKGKLTAVSTERFFCYLNVRISRLLNEDNTFKEGIICFSKGEFYYIVSLIPYPEIYARYCNNEYSEGTIEKQAKGLKVPFWYAGTMFADAGHCLKQSYVPDLNRDEEDYIKFLLSQIFSEKLDVNVSDIYYSHINFFSTINSRTSIINTCIGNRSYSKQIDKTLKRGEIFISSEQATNTTNLIFKGKQADVYKNKQLVFSFRYCFREEWDYYADVIPEFPQPLGDRMFFYASLCNEMPHAGGIARPLGLPRTLEDYLFGTLANDPRHHLAQKNPPKKLLKL